MQRTTKVSPLRRFPNPMATSELPRKGGDHHAGQQSEDPHSERPTATATREVGPRMRLLHDAVKQRDSALAQQLLAEGLDPDEPDWDNNGWPPLLTAVVRQDAQMVQVLLRACCSVDVTTFQGETALHLAVESSPLRPDIISLLLDAGADPGIPERLTGNSPLHTLVARHSYADQIHILGVLRRLVEQCDVDARNFAGCSPLHRAVSASDDDRVVAERVKVLLDAGADVNLRNEFGETALHLAADADLVQVVQCLVEDGDANINVVDRYNMTPLHYAASKNGVQITQLLTQQLHCDVNATDLNGDTPLHVAAGKGHTSVVRILRATGKLDSNVANKAGLLPLHKAIESGFVVMVQELLKTNCNLLAHTGYGMTPLDLACTDTVYRTRPEISKMILQAAQNTVSECSLGETSI